FMDDRLELTSGIYYFDEETYEDQITVIPTIFRTLGPRDTVMNTDIKSSSLYAQTTYELTGRSDITLGLRYTDDQRDGWGYQNYLNVQPITPLTFEYDKTQVNYLATYDFKFTEDLMGYISNSTGYRSAAAGLTASTTRPGEWATLLPEEVTNYEAGFKSAAAER